MVLYFACRLFYDHGQWLELYFGVAIILSRTCHASEGNVALTTIFKTNTSLSIAHTLKD